MADMAPSLEIKLDGKTLVLAHDNLSNCTISYYGMDIELLFSTEPFVLTQQSQFSYIKANKTQEVKLSADTHTTRVELPEELRSKNVMIRISAGPLSKSVPYYSNSLTVSMIETAGRLKVVKSEDNMPLARTYVKVYAKNRSGTTSFYKDGYTDLRGQFDYTSLSTDQLDGVEKFAILIFSTEFGALIREAGPPKM
eukprot:TRINITY_DN8131_c0_g1_i1.p1 TRINITY_DN8131_c0_g1~~TRINITY_DN8131_c0_g1_i1.p1  ORF type:complete len:213 (-),score=33.42 TRINITY_DN8131_c0_g1_i1:37-624(-)